MNGQVLPVRGASKAKRIAWRVAPNPISLGFMKMLRERHAGVKAYESDPYVEVYPFTENLYGLLHPGLDGTGDVWSWLVVGPQKAILVDTGFGLGDTKGVVGKIAGGKQVVVVNTHAAPASVLGNCRFDRVFCHEYDLEAIKAMGKAGAWDYLFDGNGIGRWVDFDKKDLPQARNYELVGVKDRHTFNLGGDYDVELFWTGGVTPGHSMLIDRKSRYLFPGDGVSSDVIPCGDGANAGVVNGRYANVTTYRDSLTKLLGRIDDFDYLFPAHASVNLENHVLGDIHEALEQIIANPKGYNYKVTETSITGTPGVERMHKYVRGFGTITYTGDGIRPANS